jgi:pilus assembly protein CpaE
MLDCPSAHQSESCKVVLSEDANFVQTIRAAFDTNGIAGFSILDCGLDSQYVQREIRNATILIVDLNAPQENESDLARLRQLMAQIGDIPVIVVLDAFNEIVARKLVKMRVADILVKPVAPIELLQACTAVAPTKGKESKIHTFLPVAGGVGTTTLAIQSALTLLRSKARANPSTCLVDLNFHHGTCADYLDIEPRLNMNEIELQPERLDQQLLEGMLSRHATGLAIIAAPNSPTESSSVAPNIVMGLLNVVCQCFDQIVIDMPKDWQLWTDNLVLGTNELYLIGEATVPGVRKAKQLVQLISARLGQRPRPKVIVNKFERRFFSPGMRFADLANALGDTFAGTVPYRHGLVREAIDRGVPLDEVRKDSDIAVAMRRLIVPRIAKSNSLFQSLSLLPTSNPAGRTREAALNSSRP